MCPKVLEQMEINIFTCIKSGSDKVIKVKGYDENVCEYNHCGIVFSNTNEGT